MDYSLSSTKHGSLQTKRLEWALRCKWQHQSPDKIPRRELVSVGLPLMGFHGDRAILLHNLCRDCRKAIDLFFYLWVPVRRKSHWMKTHGGIWPYMLWHRFTSDHIIRALTFFVDWNIYLHGMTGCNSSVYSTCMLLWTTQWNLIYGSYILPCKCTTEVSSTTKGIMHLILCVSLLN